MRNDLEKIVRLSKVENIFDVISFGVINFSENNFETYTYQNATHRWIDEKYFFDLASVSKVLTIGLIRLINPRVIGPELLLLLEHRSSLPAWAILSRENWREQILNYKIESSNTNYSDLGAIRAQLEYEKVVKGSLFDDCKKVWDGKVKHWTELSEEKDFLFTGWRLGKRIHGDVHDPNAYTLGEKVAHAGLFSTVDGLSKTILNCNKKFNLLSVMKEEIMKRPDERFIFGWDRAIKRDDSLAGDKGGEFTFGHLGFTGTSVWIDPVAEKGAVLLTNATKNSWYQKKELNILRKSFANLVWDSCEQ